MQGAKCAFLTNYVQPTYQQKKKKKKDFMNFDILWWVDSNLANWTPSAIKPNNIMEVTYPLKALYKGDQLAHGFELQD